jgi:hypothetical protein
MGTIRLEFSFNVTSYLLRDINSLLTATTTTIWLNEKEDPFLVTTVPQKINRKRPLLRTSLPVAFSVFSKITVCGKHSNRL